MEIETSHGNGSHLTIDAFNCNRETLESVEKITEFLNALPDHIGMNKITEPKVLHHEAENPDDSGITGFVIIAESHISVHTYPKRDFVSIDVFSCKEFDENRTTEYIKDFFGTNKIHRNSVHRGFKENFDSEDFCKEVKGYQIDEKMPVSKLMENLETIGFQATHLAQSVPVLKKMRNNNSTIFMSFTSNMVSSGLRELFAQVVKEKLVDVIVTSVGSIEEDIMKTINPFLLGEFNMDDVELHKKGINRIGNVLVPDNRYEDLEDVLRPVFTEALEEQKATGQMISPSALIKKLGLALNDENSILYWAAKNDIPIYCPAITDGALGLQLYFFNEEFKNPSLGIDTTGDMKELAKIVMESESTAGIILGGGFAKHHVIGVNILREGLDYAIYVTTAGEGDGSLSGARPREAKSWSKLKEEGDNVCIESDATIAFPLIAPCMMEILKGRK